MSKQFNTPVPVWLDMELGTLFDWVFIADQMMEEERARNNVQKLGPGL
jgi:hypothetical protein